MILWGPFGRTEFPVRREDIGQGLHDSPVVTWSKACWKFMAGLVCQVHAQWLPSEPCIGSSFYTMVVGICAKCLRTHVSSDSSMPAIIARGWHLLRLSRIQISSRIQGQEIVSVMQVIYLSTRVCAWLSFWMLLQAEIGFWWLFGKHLAVDMKNASICSSLPGQWVTFEHLEQMEEQMGKHVSHCGRRCV